MSKPSKNINLKMPTVEEDQLITVAAESDPDALPLTDEQMGRMVPMRVLRGRPKLGNKKLLISIRYSPEVIDYFKSSGAGWQARIDTVLKEYVQSRSADDAKAVTARKDDAPAADQAAMSNVAGWCSISVGGGLIQTTSG